MKILGFKNYGSIPHLSNSKLGDGDHYINSGQEFILTQKPRDRHDNILVFEKYDGSNVGVCKKDNKIYAFPCSASASGLGTRADTESTTIKSACFSLTKLSISSKASSPQSGCKIKSSSVLTPKDFACSFENEYSESTYVHFNP